MRDDFLSWSERTNIRLGELDKSGLMILSYCVGLLRGAHLALVAEEMRKAGEDVADDAVEELIVKHMQKTIQEYRVHHEGNAALIYSIIKDWANDEDAA